MHPNKIFRETTSAANLAFARERGFGMLTIASPEGLLAAHAPFLISEEGGEIELHLSRANPILAQLETPIPCLLAVFGPDGYVSPDWYGLDNNQVPTWNYVAIHFRGMLRQLPPSDLSGILERLTAQFEARLAPKPSWTPDKMDVAVYERMQRSITPLAISIEAIESTWKLGQNKPKEARACAAAAMRSAGVGNEVASLSGMMVEV